jgi:uncharacterized membrane protein YphA (DoxX/SURF4 family)
MKPYGPFAARILLGLIFFVFGLNFFLHFIPQPPMPAPAGAFAGAMFATGYIFQLLKVLEVISGLLLLTNRFVPLALAILAPIIVNIFFFHAVLAPGGVILPVVMVLLAVYLAYSYRSAYRPMLKPNVGPG